MSDTTRRAFLKAAGVAGAAVAAGPRSARADAASPVTLAFVGCAHIHTPGYVQLLRARPDVRVKWVFDADPARSRVWAAEAGATVPAGPEQVFTDPEVRGVVICSETFRHPALVAAAAKARKHMFVEKPLGITGAESREMARTIAAAGVLFTTGYFMRTDPKHLFLKEQIARGAFGRITRASAWNCHGGSLGGWFDEKPEDPANDWRWMANPTRAGVGAFGDLGTHSLDVLMWLMGGVEAVSAVVRTVTGRYGDCDEEGTALLRYSAGATGALTAGWVDLANPVTLQIAGTEGHAVVVNGSLHMQSSHLEGSTIERPWTSLPDGPKAPLHQFVDAIAGVLPQPLVAPAEAAERVVVMEAMYRAAREGAWARVA